MGELKDLFIESADSRIVMAELRKLAPGIAVLEEEPSAVLGLTRVRLDGTAPAVTDLDERTAAAVRTAAGLLGKDSTRLDDLDVLLGLVRHWARETFDGWCPVIDRDHDHGEVETNPHVKVAFLPPVSVSPPADIPAIAAGSGAPRVGIADARVYAHPELAGQELGDPVTGPPFDSLGPGHATFVAGVVRRRAPGARLVCREVLIHEAANRSWDVAQRLMAFRSAEVDVLNMSFGCLVDSAAPLPLRRAMDRLGQRTVLVAAVGNHGEKAGEKQAAVYPAAFGDVVSVGAAKADHSAADFTPDVPWLDLLAPGENIVGPFLQGHIQTEKVTDDFPSGYVSWTGSSFAAAAVTGEIARLMAAGHVDAFEARMQLLAAATGDVLPYRYPGDGAGPTS